LLCRLTGHRAQSRTVRNAGQHFSRCMRCRADLVEQDGRWTLAPKGFRIVWKAAEAPPAPTQDSAGEEEVAMRTATKRRRAAPKKNSKTKAAGGKKSARRTKKDA
jgi:hypothetical protein